MKSSESESSSQMLSDEKDKAFSSEDDTVIKEYEMSSSQQIFPSCQTGLNSKKKKEEEEKNKEEEYLLPIYEISPGRTP